MKHIVFFSGGICSYFCAKRVCEKYGAENVTLLFTDTLIEDEDLYRFIDETILKLGANYVRLADGRTPFQVYEDKKMLGNSRIAPCTHALKHRISKKWIKENCNPDDTILYLGLDWTETHRFNAPRKNWQPFKVEYPMGEWPPFLSKEQMLIELQNDGFIPPRLYTMGFSHNNCGGFCCRAGQGHFIKLLENFPERYKRAEDFEEYMRNKLGRNISYLKKAKNGSTRPYTLHNLREDYIAKQEIDIFDIGGCGCFSQEDNIED